MARAGPVSSMPGSFKFSPHLTPLSPQPSPNQAPSFNLTSGDGDVSTTGACRFDLSVFCPGTPPGASRLEACLSNQVEAEEAEGSGGSGARVLTSECRAELHAFKLARSQNINANLPLARACKGDVTKFCAEAAKANSEAAEGDGDGEADGPSGAEPNRAGIAVVQCLKRVRLPPATWMGSALKVAGWAALGPASWLLSSLSGLGGGGSRSPAAAKLSPACDAEVFKAQLDASRDFTLDPILREACSPSAAKWCAAVAPGEGRVQECLRAHRMGLDWGCRQALFRKELEDAGDGRLSVTLVRKCAADKRRFCAGVEPAGGGVEDCLEEHRLDKGFTAGCRDELEAMIVRRAADFRLDGPLVAA